MRWWQLSPAPVLRDACDRHIQHLCDSGFPVFLEITLFISQKNICLFSPVSRCVHDTICTSPQRAGEGRSEKKRLNQTKRVPLPSVAWGSEQPKCFGIKGKRPVMRRRACRHKASVFSGNAGRARKRQLLWCAAQLRAPHRRAEPQAAAQEDSGRVNPRAIVAGPWCSLTSANISRGMSCSRGRNNLSGFVAPLWGDLKNNSSHVSSSSVAVRMELKGQQQPVQRGEQSAFLDKGINPYRMKTA